MNSVEKQVNIARNELLDLSLRNTLINYRALKSRGVEVVDELPAQIFRLLVSESRALSFLPAPEKEEKNQAHREQEPLEEVLVVTLPEQQEAPEPVASEEVVIRLLGDTSPTGEEPAPHQLDAQLQTPYTAANLQQRLLNTYYTARTYIEEQGVNVLYLAMGMLRWYESTSSDVVRQAPLILVPVELNRTNVSDRFRIHYNQDDIGDNLSLRAKLKAEFGVSLPELGGNGELDVQDYFDEVSRAIARQPRWSVNRTAVALGFFSFGTFLMYNDLDMSNWPEEARPDKHPVLQAILEQGFQEPPAAIGEEESIDKYVSPQDSKQVVDADSSQTLAILDVKQGRNLVIQGPPGTGKSQTITNLIAEALGQDKTVLFVAEKMAALEVVKRRLDEVGLGDACLELHSHKSNKKTVLDELRRTLDLGRPKTRDYTADLQALVSNRDRLNEYSKAVNTPIDRSQVTPYQLYGKLLHLERQLEGVTTPGMDERLFTNQSAAEFREHLEKVGELQALMQRMGNPAGHPFRGSSYRQPYLPNDKRDIQQACQDALAAMQQLRQAAASLAGQLQLPLPTSREEAIHQNQAAQWVLALPVPSLDGVQIHAAEWHTRSTDIETALAAGGRISQLYQEYDDRLLPEAWSQNVLPIRQAYMAYGDKWWRVFSGTFRQARNQLLGLSQQGLPRDMATQMKTLEAILEAQRLQPVLAQHTSLLRQLFTAHWQGTVDWVQLQQIASWLITLHKQIAAQVFPSELLTHLATAPDRATLQKTVTAIEQGLDAHAETLAAVTKRIQLDEQVRFGKGNTLLELPFTQQEQILQQWLGAVDTLQDIVVYNQLADQIEQVGLDEIVEIAATWSEAGTHLVHLCERSWYEALLAQVMRERPVLATFDTDAHLHRIQNFGAADRLSFQINRAKLAHHHWQRLPRYTAGGQRGQLGVLQREFEKKRRHLPIRQLISQTGHAIQQIKPVFMMSPLSIAMFLPPGILHFDLVVFDEASQVRPVEAFGAILRGKQAVVVGDSRQLPPTNFFNQVLEADEETESPTADLESVLGLFAAQGAPQRMLRWHYRSHHESLITVSNHEFYENKLLIFPSPDAAKKEVGVVFRHLPHTVYDRGRSSANEQEARAVAQAVMEHARTHPNLTLGVAAFSISQMQMIQDQLEMLRRQDSSCEAYFNDHPYEPFFVKNLENVQGDERDVIFISVGYGRTAEGQISMNFGPLNKEGGERRLNVLITRAKRRCVIFTNLTADDIDLNRTQARGVVALKRYLHYAQTGRLDIPVPSGGGPESPFEEQVLAALSQRGYEIATQVGSAGFRIDLAVQDKERPGRYLLGIECDGASYHSARSARDRDRLRQEVLERMGWQIHRIWSTDWFRNPARELQRVVEAIDAARIHVPAAYTPSPPPMSNSGPVERHDTQVLMVDVQAQDYQIAQLQFQLHGELHQMPTQRLAHLVREVVKVEGPVHTKVVTRRIVDAAGLSRAGSRIRAAVLQAIAHLVRIRAIKKRGDFLWDENMQTVPLRSHANVPGFTRGLERIAPEEIMLAVQTVVKNGLGMRQEDIPLAACTLLGFGRTSEGMRLQVEQLIEDMLGREQLQKRGDFLVVE